MIAVLFPTRFEGEAFAKGLGGKPVWKNRNGVEMIEGKLGGRQVVVAIVGVGPKIATLRTQKILKFYPFQYVILAGFAGALNENLERGHVLIASKYCQTDTYNYLKLIPNFDMAALVSTDKVVATAEDKAKLREKSGCQMVDMETESVAKVVEQHGIEFIAVRAISDLYNESLPIEALESAYDYRAGKPTPLKLCIYFLFHPQEISAFKRFLEPLPGVRASLTAFLFAAVPDL
ncbi:MAG: hypothetical protein AAGA18_14575 [Verrucomicrobiota bacterium]